LTLPCFRFADSPVKQSSGKTNTTYCSNPSQLVKPYVRIFLGEPDWSANEKYRSAFSDHGNGYKFRRGLSQHQGIEKMFPLESWVIERKGPTMNRDHGGDWQLADGIFWRAFIWGAKSTAIRLESAQACHSTRSRASINTRHAPF